jgi:hypothetical protein
MAAYVLINWSKKEVTEFAPSDMVDAFEAGGGVGESNDDITLYQVDVSPPRQRYPKADEHLAGGLHTDA